MIKNRIKEIEKSNKRKSTILEKHRVMENLTREKKITQFRRNEQRHNSYIVFISKGNEKIKNNTTNE